MDHIKRVLSKAKAGDMEEAGEKTFISGIDTRYGKQLAISNNEKESLVDSLTSRERETFLILLGGYGLKEAAKQIGIKYSTANTHQTAIYKKLHVHSRAELIINYKDICGENTNRL
ncbi:MAG: Bacterial regulatory protein luxR family [Clostridiales bacterium]|jgi:DNA-binding CsgD family transcriptional regulator|nr:Bacterial regulatory protein luxR family [Clostridiales bacterium]